MRAFLKWFRKLHLWLLADLLVLGLFFALRTQRALMNFFSACVAMPLERGLGRLWSVVPFSAAELCYAAAILGLPVYFAASAFAVYRAEYKRDELYRRALILLNTVLSLYAAFCLLWGVNFYCDDFCDRSGIRARPVSREDLLSVTRLFAEQAARCADQVPRNADGTCAADRGEALSLAPALYDAVSQELPFLRLRVDPRPKPVFFSRVMSAMNVTGLYFPFTGESNLNMDFPVATFPATVAHELAHRRGIASEQQCNFLAVLASTRSPYPAYRYSGWLLGYIHLYNALYSVDPEACRDLSASLPETVRADLRAANEYWARYDGRVSRASGRAYDAMLRSYGDELGMRSYGAVVDLLVAYYGD